MAGAARFDVVRWPECEAAVRSVRHAVFTVEQGIAAALDFDGSDAGCVQVIAFDAAGAAVGTGRMKTDGHIGRIAVLRAWRGRGIGDRLLTVLVAEARARGLASVHLNAQCTAIAFYARHGFAATGESFDEAGIAHQRMERALAP